MKKQYLFAFLFSMFALITLSSVLATEDSLENSSSTEIRVENGRTETRIRTEVRTRMDLNNDFDDEDDDQGGDRDEDQDDDRRTELESHREEMRRRAEIRKTEAESRGDEARVKREQMKIDLENRWAEMDAKREAKRAEIEEKRASNTAKRVEFQQEIARRKVEQVTKVMLATIERLEKIATRIESRIAKITARGGDTAESEKFVAEAKMNLLDARIKVNAFVGIDLSSDRAAENFERIRAAAAEARGVIRVAHENLMMAVRSLRVAEIDTEDSSSSEDEE